MVRIQHTDDSSKANVDTMPTADELDIRLMEQARELSDFARDPRDGDQEVHFRSFEQALIPKVFAIARTAIALFLTCAEARVRAATPTRLVRNGQSFQRTTPKLRALTTWFGAVRYTRTYMLERDATDEGHGFFPLDLVLGLTSDRFSLSMLAAVVRLSTALSFATAKATAELFLPDVPSTEVIEKATVGLGRFTDQWFEQAPPPEGDGDVLVILFDGKGAPQCTDEELALRRRPWKGRPRPASPRHRGRSKRGRQGPKKRRKKGDKSKNAKMATVVVMYTLRTVGTELHGPVNPWFYASFAPKQHAFAIAWREAKKRGFDPEGPDDVIQIVTDGDEDLARYAKLFFPHAIHTLDVMHAIEKLWEAGGCLFSEGSEELTAFVEELKDVLYAGRVEELVRELRRRRRALCRSKKNEGRRARLAEIIRYLAKRVEMMNYAELIDEDLEIGSGAVEGAVKHIVAKRCDQGGMRWIAERMEAVVQLRCIEVNGDWDAFVEFVHDSVRQQQTGKAKPIRIQQHDPEPLPDLLEPQGWSKAA